MTAALEGSECSAARPGKDLVPILQEGGWAPGPVWKGGKSPPHRDSIPDRPVRSSVAIPTELPGPHYFSYYSLISIHECIVIYDFRLFIIIATTLFWLNLNQVHTGSCHIYYKR